MKKIIALLLITVMVCAMLVACGEDKPVDTSKPDASQENPTSQPEQSTPEDASETSEEASAEGEQLLLPDKYWGKTLEMVVNKTHYYEEFEFWWDEEVVDENPVVDAIVERSRILSDNYGITLNVTFVDGLGKPQAAVENAINGTLQLDLIADGAQSLAPKTVNGWYLDLYEENAKYNDGKGWLNLEASWWDQTAIRDLSFGNKLYFVTGDICVSDDDSTWAMYFNKDLIKKHNLEDPYKLVDENRWTMDKMIEMAKDSDVVLMHGSKMSYDPDDGDVFGIVCQAYDGIMFMLGCEQSMIKKDGDDLPVMRITEQRFVDVHAKMFDMYIDDSYCGMADLFGAWDSGVYNQETQIFANGNALFMPQSIMAITDSASVVSQSDVNYGIIPLPKFDSIQENYSSSATVYWLKVVGVPITCDTNAEATLFALEALAYYGQKIVTPKYYSQVLKGQKLKDEESERMLDLIFRNRTYDMGTVYNFGSGNVEMIQFYNNVLYGRPANKIMNVYETYRDGWQASIDTFIDTFKKLNN